MAKNLLSLQLLDILPSSISPDPQVAAICRALDPELQSVSRDIREALILSRIDELPEPVLDLLAWQLHVDFYEPTELSIAKKRALVKGSIAWHRKKGTPWAVKKILEDLGVEARILEWYDIGTEPYTFAVEASYDYANSEPFFINADTHKLLMRAIEITKPARAHLAYFTFVPTDEEDDPDHICRHDVCHWSHGYLWSDDRGVKIIGDMDGGRPRAVDGGMKIRVVGSAAYQWSQMYGSTRFGDLPKLPIAKVVFTTLRKLVSLAEREHAHRWHKTCAWACGGTWSEACATPRTAREILDYARSSGRFGYGEPMGDINCCFSGGYELVLSDIGTYGTDTFSGREIEEARFSPIDEFTEQTKTEIVPRREIPIRVRRAITWES